MSGAFYGDPAVKAVVAARVGAAEAGGVGYSDAAALAQASAYPLSLAALLQPLVQAMRPGHRTDRFRDEYIDCVAPGADLNLVPTRIALAMLSAPEIADRPTDADALVAAVADLHQRMLGHTQPDPGEWKALRQRLLAIGTDVRGASDRRAHARLTLCEAASWPASRGRSTLPAMMRGWLAIAEIEHDPTWSEEDHWRKEAVLRELWNDKKAERDGALAVDFPALFHDRDDDLATRFEANLARVNERWVQRAQELGVIVMTILSAASDLKGEDTLRSSA